MKTEPMFLVDHKGLAKLLERRGKEFAVVELLQNAWDEEPSRVDVHLTPEPGVPYCILQVEDDDPNGFRDLAHAYTLFAESRKKTDPAKRGRFNIGEKLVIALCTDAMIATTTGTVYFDHTGRVVSRRKRDRGTLFQGRVKMTRVEYERTCEVIRTLLPPRGIITSFNGDDLKPRDPSQVFRVALPTEIADDEGYLRPTTRFTEVEVHPVRDGEVGHLYELGIPVVETGDTFHVNVLQKVPLNADRDNVTPSFLRVVRTHVLNRVAAELSSHEASEQWVGEALEGSLVTDEAVSHVLDHRFGKKRVVADPSDREAEKIAVSRGYAVISSRAFSKAQWSNIRRSGAALPAGQVTPSPKPFHPDGRPLKTLGLDEWTDEIRWTVLWVQKLGKHLLGYEPSVVIANDSKWGFGGCFGNQTITINLARLGRDAFGSPTPQMMRLIIHEFSHQEVSDHLSERFYQECCRMGARLTTLALEEPDLFRPLFVAAAVPRS